MVMKTECNMHMTSTIDVHKLKLCILPIVMYLHYKIKDLSTFNMRGKY